MIGMWRVTCAWAALALAGCSQAIIGPADLWGTYGERLVYAAALGFAGFVVWLMGESTRLERTACWCTTTASLAACFSYPFAGRLEFNTLAGLAELGQCSQLGAWALAARKTHYLPGIYIILVGMLTDTLVVLPWGQLQIDLPSCPSAMRWTCLASPEAAMSLPFLISMALVALWLVPLHDRIRRL